MSEEREMTTNEALQELTRFTNLWRGANKMREALDVAVRVEREMSDLSKLREDAEGYVSKAQSEAELAIAGMKQETAEAEAKHQESMEVLRERHAEEHTMMLNQMVAETMEAERTLARMNNECERRQVEIDEKIKSLEARRDEVELELSDLNAELDSIRQRLG